VIGLVAASRVYAGMTWLRMRRGKLVYLCGALLALPVLGAAVLALAGHWGAGFFDELTSLYFGFLIPFVPALLASSCVAEEIDRRTFTFVFTRPAPRAALVVGKAFAVAAPLALATTVGLALSWLIALARFPGDMADGWPHLLHAELAAALGVFAYSALATAIGSLFTRHPFVATAAWLLLVEAGLGSAPVSINVLAIAWHLRNLAGLPNPEVPFMAAHIGAMGSALLLAAAGVLFFGFAILAVRNAEYHGRDG
jgi:ABC-type transport system involved in multi-copper enzyme maturation permease subunit